MQIIKKFFWLNILTPWCLILNVLLSAIVKSTFWKKVFERSPHCCSSPPPTLARTARSARESNISDDEFIPKTYDNFHNIIFGSVLLLFSQITIIVLTFILAYTSVEFEPHILNLWWFYSFKILTPTFTSLYFDYYIKL